MKALWPRGERSALLDQIEQLRADLVAFERSERGHWQDLPPMHRARARNLLHYVALRQRDVRPLQERLARLGLSSLGRSEPHVLANLDLVIGVLRRLGRRPAGSATRDDPGHAFVEGPDRLWRHADELLGPEARERSVRIMVTAPSEAADDIALVHHLLARGMDVLRINCAHDDEPVWARMIANLRTAERATGRGCRVLMDLPGPKLRTGPVAPGPKVLRVRPERDALGRVVRPAQLWLQAAGSVAAPDVPVVATLPVDGAWLAQLQPDDTIALCDTRDAQRLLTVRHVVEGGCRVELARTTYFAPGLELRCERDGAGPCATKVGDLPAQEQALRLDVGDRLLVTADEEPGRAAAFDANGTCVAPARIGCTLPEVFAAVVPGERIWFDDGKIGAEVQVATPDRLDVRILQAPPTGAKLRGDKGINLPDTRLPLPALTERDREVLPFVARHADMAGYSFVRDAAGVRALQEALVAAGGEQVGLVLKIETREAFDHLPALLLAGLRSPALGVMIARGDLAIELGFERLAEVQEEILWFCEAAQVPVIWATQVLESLAKGGIPTRAEITDAAMGVRAECVMLNKGPRVLEAVRVLDDILRRMEAHQDKKRSMLRELRLARGFG